MRYLCVMIVLLLIPGSIWADSCDIPSNYTNKTYVQHGDLMIGFATNRKVYPQDGTIEFFLTITNMGTETFYKAWPYSPADAYAILPPMCDSVDQDDCRAYSLLVRPTVIYWYGFWLNLLPGDCQSFHYAWQIPPPSKNGQPIRPIDANYTVLGGFFQIGDLVTSWGNFVIPPGGAKLKIKITDPVPTEHNTWGQIKSLFSHQ